MIAILCNQTLVILTVTLTMTDVPSKHVWKIKESRIVFKDYIYISMKVSVLLPGNSANTVCLTSEKGKVARQQQVVRQAGVRGNLQLLCNWSKVARTGNYKR